MRDFVYFDRLDNTRLCPIKIIDPSQCLRQINQGGSDIWMTIAESRAPEGFCFRQQPNRRIERSDFVAPAPYLVGEITQFAAVKGRVACVQQGFTVKT